MLFSGNVKKRGSGRHIHLPVFTGNSSKFYINLHERTLRKNQIDLQIKIIDKKFLFMRLCCWNEPRAKQCITSTSGILQRKQIHFFYFHHASIKLVNIIGIQQQLSQNDLCSLLYLRQRQQTFLTSSSNSSLHVYFVHAQSSHQVIGYAREKMVDRHTADFYMWL